MVHFELNGSIFKDLRDNLGNQNMKIKKVRVFNIDGV